MPNLQETYQYLPYPLKALAATIRGYQLNKWRFGLQTQVLVLEATERESWAPEKWQTWQSKKLVSILEHAATKVPYYKNYWQSQSIGRESLAYADLNNWPILKKEIVRGNNDSFLANNCDESRMFCDHTSGTSGTPLKIWQRRETVQAWYALFEARWRGWYGLSRHDRWAIFGGQLVIPFKQKRPPFWVWNHAMHQLYCSTYHIREENVLPYVEALTKHKLKYILGYPSAIYTLAKIGLGLNLAPPNLKVIISNAEPLLPYQKECIELFFKCPVFDTYGMAETVCAASQCEAGIMHLWLEAGITEVLALDSDEPVPDGETGRIVCTGLLNLDMPLIRYDTGDLGAIDSRFQKCDCGRTLPRLLRIEGRMDDMIKTKDGRWVGRLDPIFKTDLHLREAQIIQESLEKFTIKYVPSMGWSELDEFIIQEGLHQRVGDVQILFEEVNEIPRQANGKFKAVLSKIND